MHLSMRVPWRDRPWDGAVCDAPLANSSCVLLSNIGTKRDDAWEASNPGVDMDTLDANRLPCLSERATFMSATGYTVVKTHPYAWNTNLTGDIQPTPVPVPPYAFEAVPFRWLNRSTLNDEVGHLRVPGFRYEAEEAIDHVLGFGPTWVMDGSNQRAVIDAFFEPINQDDSLVFIYLKHSPLQDQRADRLLVGAARITGITPPPMWNQPGNPPFESSMWEAIVQHSLRPDQRDGVLLPYQELVRAMDDGKDVSAALAWAPEGRTIEFSYVTEHLSDDAAIQALASLEEAARALPDLGLSVPEAALTWIEAQTARLWKLRGPVPGLAAVLAHLGVERAHLAAREFMGACPDGADPWPAIEAGFADAARLPAAVRPLIGGAVGRVWAKRTDVQQASMRMLSGLDISADQVAVLLEGRTEVDLPLSELLEDPYWASICTYGQPEHIPFTTIDRACFPGGEPTWKPLVATPAFDDHQDQRRIRALLVDVLESAGSRGDTVMSQAEVITAANQYVLSRPPGVTEWLLEGVDLDSATLAANEQWSPLVGVELADGVRGLKLRRFEDTSDIIRNWVDALRKRPRLGEVAHPRALIDAVLPTLSGQSDDTEERARAEKAAGLAELYGSALSVLIGPAGTGKTTLLKALADQLPGRQVLLLAPTGKARVQMQTRIGRPAATLASFLAATDRYDGERYLVRGDESQRFDADLVVIDEASMLTEQMLAATLDALRHVKRLVLVGDPRQLPPIGAGRPFVDLVNHLCPAAFASPIRVASSYVELRIPRRQIAGAAQQGGRADLELAAWFGDGDVGVDGDHIWNALATTTDLDTVRYVPWAGRSVSQALADTLAEELHLQPGPDLVRQFATSYGAVVNEPYLNFDLGAGGGSEAWQILSPTRSRAYGTTEINRHIKRTYRGDDLAYALVTRKANIPRPIGPEQIVRGDKVMATRNGKRTAWPAHLGLGYVANGEIGVAIGRPVPASSRKKKSLALSVEFSSQPGAQYSYWPSQSDDPPLELAWAVTVHKSQGSEFELTILVLPQRTAVSRELMYTALTRQSRRVAILHEGTLEDLRQLAAPWRSETARRLTDLFAAPELVSVDVGGKPQRFDGRVIHIAPGDVVVKSKNEVIVALVLQDLFPGKWVYEKPLHGSDGHIRYPDFTIEQSDGSLVYWEHLGMLDDVDYARKWALKEAWYAANGILLHPGRGPNGTLMTTDDTHGVDAPGWRAFAEEVIGNGPAPVAGRRGGPRGPGERRAGPGT